MKPSSNSAPMRSRNFPLDNTDKPRQVGSCWALSRQSGHVASSRVWSRPAVSGRIRPVSLVQVCRVERCLAMPCRVGSVWSRHVMSGVGTQRYVWSRQIPSCQSRRVGSGSAATRSVEFCLVSQAPLGHAATSRGMARPSLVSRVSMRLVQSGCVQSVALSRGLSGRVAAGRVSRAMSGHAAPGLVRSVTSRRVRSGYVLSGRVQSVWSRHARPSSVLLRSVLSCRVMSVQSSQA